MAGRGWPSVLHCSPSPTPSAPAGDPVSGRVKDRDINLAGDANRSAHRARRSFKANAGSRAAPHHREMSSARAGSYSVPGGGNQPCARRRFV
jgi:hypothetical protein